MIRTEAPKDLEGRGVVNLARTTPELPRIVVSTRHVVAEGCEASRSPGYISRTVRSGDLAPDHSDLGTTDLLLRLVDIRDLLAEVEAVCPTR